MGRFENFYSGDESIETPIFSIGRNREKSVSKMKPNLFNQENHYEYIQQDDNDFDSCGYNDDALKSYLIKYPNGRHREEAKLRLSASERIEKKGNRVLLFYCCLLAIIIILSIILYLTR